MDDVSKPVCLTLNADSIVRAIAAVVEATAPSPEEFQRALKSTDGELKNLAKLIPPLGPIELATVEIGGVPLTVSVTFSSNIFEAARAVIAEKRGKVLPAG